MLRRLSHLGPDPRRDGSAFGLAVALFLVAASLACQEGPGADELSRSVEEQGAGIEVVDPRANVLAGMGTVYLTVKNPGPEGDRLVRVESSQAAAAETHETVEEDGVMRMVPRPEGFEVPAASTLELEPGGKHIMLVEPRLPKLPEHAEGGGTIPLTLVFEHHGAIELQVPVVSPAGEPPE